MNAVSLSYDLDNLAYKESFRTPFADCHALGRIFVSAGKSPTQAFELAQKLLSRAGSIAELIQSSTERLKIIGADESEIETIKAVGGAIDATLLRRLEDRPIFSNSQTVVDYLYAKISFRHRESLECIYLNTKLRFLHSETISVGSVNVVDMNVRDIVKMALELNSSNLIICHNHPSGNLEPSRDDVQSTRALDRVCRDLNIRLLDHLIVSYSGFSSMRASGTLD